MYYFSAYLSLVLAVLLVPFLIPIRIKSVIFHRAKILLSICLVISVLVGLTPEKAVNGAPFHEFGQARIAYLSCSYQIRQTALFCPDINPNECLCTNKNALATVAHCYYNGFESLIPDFISQCRDAFNVSLTKDDMARSHEYYYEHAQPAQGPQVVMDSPVILQQQMITLYKDSYEQFLGNYDRSVWYGGVLVMFWMTVFALAALGNWGKIIFPRFFAQSTGPLTNMFRRNISLPATRGSKKTAEKPLLGVFDMLVPTRAESLILAAFGAITTFLVFYDMHYCEGDPLFHSRYRALLRYHAVRTSILASEVMPLLILFGGRNNFLQWVTRWDYSTFITFHRWISRIVVVLVLVHTVCYTLMLERIRQGDFEPYLIAGGFATLAGILILVQGLLVLRRRWYEIFLLIHIVLAAVFIFGAWLHVNDLYCLWFYYYSASVWVFDRVVRVGRLCSFGFPSAKVLLLADETLKVVVPKPQHWDAVPGGHAFIHFLRPSCFWQSHPFTYTLSPDNSNEIVMFVKVKEGVTSRLYKYLLTHPGRTTSIRVAIEGSYGEKTAASRYDSAVFVAGGNGIPGIYAEALDLERSNSKQNIKLYWVIREYKSLYWFYEELMSLKDCSIDTIVYVTRPDSESCLEDFELRYPEEEATQDTKLLTHPKPQYHSTSSTINAKAVIQKVANELSHVEFRIGRPSMKGIVSESVIESNGSTCFVTCGHPVMVDDLRRAVVDNIDNKEGKRVDYFEQLQVWA